MTGDSAWELRVSSPCVTCSVVRPGWSVGTHCRLSVMTTHCRVYLGAHTAPAFALGAFPGLLCPCDRLPFSPGFLALRAPGSSILCPCQSGSGPFSRSPGSSHWRRCQGSGAGCWVCSLRLGCW